MESGMEKKTIKKNDIYTIEIEDLSTDGSGIGKIDGYTLFVKDALIGDTAEVKVIKTKKNYGYGRLMRIITPSPDRVEAPCPHARSCGGCQIQHLSYERQLAFKENKVRNLLSRVGHVEDYVMHPIIGMENPYHYRNKAQYPVGINKEGKKVIGVFANRTHEIIPIEKCYIQNERTEQLAKFILEYINKNNISVYNEKTGKGLLRHIVTKIGIKTNQIMCILVVNGKVIPKEKELVKNIVENFSEVKTIVKNINTKNTNVILGQENINIYGEGYIEDILGEYVFKISPLSFYQVNPIQAEKLYNIGVEAAKITKNDIIFDLYCGIGTISLFMAKYAKKVYGVEIVEQAIVDAKENAKINGIDNTEFIVGDTEKILDELINARKIVPDAIMVDPPRRGLDNTSIDNILKIKPSRLIYISCNPATLVRDLSKFEEVYDVRKIKPVDMFPFTSHVECVTMMQLKKHQNLGVKVKVVT